GARRVISTSLVEQKLNNQSPSLSKQLNTPLSRYSAQTLTSTGSSICTATGSGNARRTRLSRSQNAASLSVSPTGEYRPGSGVKSTNCPLWAKHQLRPHSSRENGCVLARQTWPTLAWRIWPITTSLLIG